MSRTSVSVQLTHGCHRSPPQVRQTAAVAGSSNVKERIGHRKARREPSWRRSNGGSCIGNMNIFRTYNCREDTPAGTVLFRSAFRQRKQVHKPSSHALQLVA